MRLIDADALMQNIPSEEMIAKMAVAHAPTIDAIPRDLHDKTCEAMAKRHIEEVMRLEAETVSVVRCVECKYWDGEACHAIGEDVDWIVTQADDYCSYGEKGE